MFPSFSDTTTFLASYVTSPYSDTFSLASSEDGFDTCSKKVGVEEEYGVILCAGTGLFNLNYSSVLPTDSTIASTDKAWVFPYFFDTSNFFASSVPSPSSDTFSPPSSSSSLSMTHFPWSPPLPPLPLTRFPRPTPFPHLPIKATSWCLPNCVHFDALDLLSFAFFSMG